MTYEPPPGWGEFGWNFIPKAERVCRVCKQPIKRVADVGQEGTLYPSNQRYLTCKDCIHGRSKAP